MSICAICVYRVSMMPSRSYEYLRYQSLSSEFDAKSQLSVFT